jgi:hypothetical protein
VSVSDSFVLGHRFSALLRSGAGRLNKKGRWGRPGECQCPASLTSCGPLQRAVTLGAEEVVDNDRAGLADASAFQHSEDIELKAGEVIFTEEPDRLLYSWL